MAVTKSILKLTETDCVIKVAGTDGTETISLTNDLTRAATEVAASSGQRVVITTLTWTGEANATMALDRNGTRVYTLLGSASAQLDLNGQFTTYDPTEAEADIDVTISGGQGEVILRLQKMEGYKLKIETGFYGQYDDPNAIGPLTVDGAPGPQGLSDVPVIGSGDYYTTQSFDVSEVGTPYAPNYYFDAIENETPGLYRRTFSGNFSPAPSNGVDVNFCRNNPGYYGKVDEYVGFGGQNLDESNYTLEWTGWFKAPADGTYNFWVQSDDDMYMWIGASALDGDNSDGNQQVYTSNGLSKNNDSVQLLGGMYYPVRIQFTEFSGAEQGQVYWASTTDDVAYAGNTGGNPVVWFHNSATKGI